MSQTEQSRGSDSSQETGEWVAVSTLRIALAIIGLVLLLFALGQAMGLDLLATMIDGVTTTVGRWLVVAALALLVIGFAVWGFDEWSR